MKHHASTNLVAHEPFILLEVRELLLKLTVLICESLYLGTRSILHCNVVSGVWRNWVWTKAYRCPEKWSPRKEHTYITKICFFIHTNSTQQVHAIPKSKPNPKQRETNWTCTGLWKRIHLASVTLVTVSTQLIIPYAIFPNSLSFLIYTLSFLSCTTNLWAQENFQTTLTPTRFLRFSFLNIACRRTVRARHVKHEEKIK